jgi:hypothetical protein
MLKTGKSRKSCDLCGFVSLQDRCSEPFGAEFEFAYPVNRSTWKQRSYLIGQDVLGRYRTFIWARNVDLFRGLNANQDIPQIVRSIKMYRVSNKPEYYKVANYF